MAFTIATIGVTQGNPVSALLDAAQLNNGTSNVLREAVCIGDPSTYPNVSAVKGSSLCAANADPALVVVLSASNNLPNIIQKANAISGSAVLTLAKAFTNANVAQNTGFVGVSIGNWAASNWAIAVTDTNSNIWVLDKIVNNGTTLAVAVFRCATLAAGANTVTATVSGTSAVAAAMAMQIYEVSGLIIGDVSLDTNQSATGTGTAVTTPSAQEENVNDIVFTVFGTGTGAASATVPQGWNLDSGNLLPTGGGLVLFGSASRFASDPDPISGSATLNASANWAAITVSYYPPNFNVGGTVLARLFDASNNPIALGQAVKASSLPIAIASDQTVAKGTQASAALGVQDYKDSGRNPITLYLDAVTGITTEALVTMNIVKGLAAATTGTSYTVTVGKTFRIQSISITLLNTSTTAITSAKFRVRAASSSFSVTSPIIMTYDVTPSAATAVSGASVFAEQEFPDGYELPAGSIIGMSDIASAATCAFTVTLVGYEY